MLINQTLKALFGALSAGIAVLVGATVQADVTWSAITVNTWLSAAGAAIVAFNLVFWPPNTTAPK